MRSPAGFKRLERNVRRLRLYFSRCIYEVTGPRYALICFATHVEARSPPAFCVSGYLEGIELEEFNGWIKTVQPISSISTVALRIAQPATGRFLIQAVRSPILLHYLTTASL